MKTGSFPIRAFASSIVATLLLLQTSNAEPGGQAPFRGSWNTWHADVMDFDPLVGPFIRVTVAGTGQALHLGRAACETSDQLAVLLTGDISATYTYTAANGDTLVIRCIAQTVGFDPVAQRLEFQGGFEVIGGTGRFSSASGSGTLVGWAIFIEPLGSPANEGPGYFAFDGTLSVAPSQR